MPHRFSTTTTIKTTTTTTTYSFVRALTIKRQSLQICKLAAFKINTVLSIPCTFPIKSSHLTTIQLLEVIVRRGRRQDESLSCCSNKLHNLYFLLKGITITHRCGSLCLLRHRIGRCGVPGLEMYQQAKRIMQYKLL